MWLTPLGLGNSLAEIMIIFHKELRQFNSISYSYGTSLGWLDAMNTQLQITLITLWLYCFRCFDMYLQILPMNMTPNLQMVSEEYLLLFPV